MAYVDLDSIQTGFTSGDVPLAAWGQQANDNAAYLWDVMSGDWQHYDPAWDILLSDGNLLYEAYYWKWGREVRAQASYRIGSTTTFQASTLMVLPQTAVSSGNVIGQWLATDVSTGYAYSGPIISWTTTTMVMVAETATPGLVSATAPFAWAVGDELTISLAYRSAS